MIFASPDFDSVLIKHLPKVCMNEQTGCSKGGSPGETDLGARPEGCPGLG